MSKIGLIIGREFNQRVRKRTFILTTVLTPLLMVVLMVAPVLLNKVAGNWRSWCSTAAVGSPRSCKAARC